MKLCATQVYCNPPICKILIVAIYCKYLPSLFIQSSKWLTKEILNFRSNYKREICHDVIDTLAEQKFRIVKVIGFVVSVQNTHYNKGYCKNIEKFTE